MTDAHPFPPEELATRVKSATDALAGAGLDGLLIAVPENIYYLTGLDHWGYFAAHVLVLAADGRMALCARAMEGVTVANQVTNARFYGHADHEALSDHVHRAMRDLGLAGGRVGLEKKSLFLTPAHAEAIQAGVAGAWVDASGLIDGLRQIKSPLEITYVRKAAAAADIATGAAIEAVRDGASDYEVAAEYHRAVILAGSEYPGFGPFIRPGARLGEEHTTWRGDRFATGDAVFLETCAAVRKYQAPMGRLIYVGHAPEGTERSAEIAARGMAAICDALQPGAPAGVAYAAWHAVAAEAGLGAYHRHHCGYMVGIGFPPSWTGGSMVTALAPRATWPLAAGMVFHVHSWFTNCGIPDFFVSNTVLLGADGAEILTARTPQELILRR